MLTLLMRAFISVSKFSLRDLYLESFSILQRKQAIVDTIFIGIFIKEWPDIRPV